MRVKHVFGVMLLGLALPFGAVAEPQDKAEDLATALNLDEGRTQELTEIVEAYQEQRKQVMKRAHDQVKELREQSDEQLEAVLTDEEYERYEAIMALTQKDKHHKKRKKSDNDNNNEDQDEN